MKSLYTLLFIGLASGACAQSTLTGANFNPQLGETFVTHYQASPFATQGSAGANITWDYHTLQGATTDTSIIVNYSSTPDGSQFAGSSFAAGTSTEGYAYYTADADSFALKGAYTPGAYGDTIVYNGNILLKYPFSYNSSFTNNYTAVDNSFFDIPSNNTGTETVTCDGYGTLILPADTIQNALRVHVAQQETDVTNGTFHVTYNKYYWFAPGFHSYLLEINYFYTQETNITDTVVGYVTRTTGPSSIPNTNMETTLVLYPNPVQKTLYINFNIPETQMVSVTISDMLGRQMGLVSGEMYAQGAHQLTYSTSCLPKGMYLVHLQSNTGSVTRKIEVM